MLKCFFDLASHLNIWNLTINLFKKNIIFENLLMDV